MQAQNGAPVYVVINRQIYTKQGTSSFTVSGFNPIITGIPSTKLLPSTNTVMGYFNGQMLARTSGVKADTTPSGLIAGGIINFDPASLDTGQKQWIKWVMNDGMLTEPLQLVDPYTAQPFSPNMFLSVATPGMGWQLMNNFLYASGTPETDIEIVKQALIDAGYENAQETILAPSQEDILVVNLI